MEVRPECGCCKAPTGAQAGSRSLSRLRGQALAEPDTAGDARHTGAGKRHPAGGDHPGRKAGSAAQGRRPLVPRCADAGGHGGYRSFLYLPAAGRGRAGRTGRARFHEIHPRRRVPGGRALFPDAAAGGPERRPYRQKQPPRRLPRNAYAASACRRTVPPGQLAD